ncbi:MAG TPA: ABC transporter substrate-binding protein [Pseudolabrys sp.]|nr:ABC transporter substrate-binding protein [Pseudolabrys sp.]
MTKSGRASRRNVLKGIGLAALGAAPAAGLMEALISNAAAQQAVNDVASKANKGGQLTLAIAREPPTLVSFWTPDTQASTISPKITDGLLTFDLDLKPIPQLATSWTVSPDGKEYTFNLRKGVKWHDGKPFTARDVEFSLKLAGEWHTRTRLTLAKVTEYVIPDDHTIVLRLSAPAPYLLIGLIPNEAPILPRHLFEGTDVIKNRHNFAPVGTGPFKFEKWERGNYISVVRNEDYWGDKPANLDRIIFRIIPDASARGVALETGEVDIAAWNPIPITDLPRLSNYPHLAVNREGYNYRPSPFSIEFNLTNPYLKDIRVRHAFAHALDIKSIVKVIFFDEAIPHVTPVSPFSKGYFKDISGYAFDIDKANKLLDEAGFPRKDDGIRFKLAFRHVGDRSEFRPLADFIKASLRRVGIDLTVVVIDEAAWGPIYQAQKWDTHVTIATNMIDPALGVARFYQTPDPKAKTKQHASGYSNPEVDALLAKALDENDDAKRFELWHRFQDIAVRDLPRLYLVTVKNYTVYNKRAKNFTEHIDGVRGSFVGTYLEAKS